MCLGFGPELSEGVQRPSETTMCVDLLSTEQQVGACRSIA